MTDMLKINIHYGTVELVSVDKAENGETWLGGYSIYRDRDGNEISRTEPTYNTRVYWS